MLILQTERNVLPLGSATEGQAEALCSCVDDDGETKGGRVRGRRTLSCDLNLPMFFRVVTSGCVPVCSAYCSAGSPKASQPIGWRTL